MNGITESLRIQSQAGFKGTYLYSSPETIRTESFSEAGDVYSFAMIIIHSVTDINRLCLKLIDGLRPKISEIVPDAYRELIERCWSNNPDERPKFSDITEELKNNPAYITPLVDKDEFLDYVDFIDNTKISFDLKKHSIHMNEIFEIKNKKFKRMTVKKNDEKIIAIFPEEKNEEINASTSIKKAEKDEFVGFFPLVDYNELNTKCQNIVNEAESDNFNQYLLGVNLIEGKNEFPKNIQIGMKYLPKSKDGRCKESMIYLCKLFIDGKIISQDLNEANKIINEIDDKKCAEYFLLLGKIEDQKMNYSNAKKYYKKSIKLKNAEAMYCYGKLFLDGKGIKKNDKKSKKYFDLAQKNGYDFLNQTETNNDQDNEISESDDIFESSSKSESDEFDTNNQNSKFKPKFITKNFKEDVSLKVVVVGDEGDYKTKLLIYLVVGHLNREYIPTVFENYKAKVKYHGKKIHFLLWDTSGSEEMFNIRVLNYANTDIILLVFSLTNKISFQNIFDIWLPEINENTKEKPMYLLVGVGFEIWSKDPHNPDYVHQEDLDLASENKDIYKVIKCSYWTGANMESISFKALADAYFDAHKLKEKALIKKSAKYNFANNIKIQICCVGSSQSGIEYFLEHFKKKDDFKEQKIIELVEDFDISHIFKGKDVILQFSQAYFQDAVQIIQSKKKSKTQVILFIFSLIHKDSFQFLINEWSANVKNYKQNDIILLVGVDSENWDNETPDLVIQREIKIFAQRIGAYKVIKCSYATGNKIEYLKDQIIKSIVTKK